MEVLTLQLGHFSNHVGAHFWNFQDEIAAVEEARHQQRHEAGGGITGDSWSEVPEGLNFERLHARSERRRGQVTWRPRLVLVDRRGALGGSGSAWAETEVAGASGAAATGDVACGLWDFGQVSHRSEPAWTHQFQRDLISDERAYEALWQSSGGAHSSWGPMDVEAEDEEEDDERADRGIVPNPTVPSCVKTSSEYDFSSSVKTWTDFLKIKLPAGTTHELNGCHHGVDPFATFFDGLGMRGREEEDELLDLVRRQSELCDQLDAVHVLLDYSDGFGGVGDIVLRWVREEQPKCGKLVAAVQPEAPHEGDGEGNGQEELLQPSAAARDAEACVWVSAAFSVTSVLNIGVDAWLPLAVPLWSVGGLPYMPSLRRNSFYETSAPIAAALDTATLPYRLSGGLRPSRFLSTVAPSHRPVCGLLHALPLPPPPTPPSDRAKTRPGPSDCTVFSESLFDLTATRPISANPFTSVVLRGASPRRLVEITRAFHPQARRSCFTHELPLPLPLPFPQAFSPGVTAQGVVGRPGSPPARLPGDDVEECPAATQLHAAAHAGRPQALKRMAVVLKSRRRSAWAAAVRDKYGVEADEFQDALETVIEHLECGAGDDDSDDDEDSG